MATRTLTVPALALTLVIFGLGMPPQPARTHPTISIVSAASRRVMLGSLRTREIVPDGRANFQCLIGFNQFQLVPEGIFKACKPAASRGEPERLDAVRKRDAARFEFLHVRGQALHGKRNLAAAALAFFCQVERKREPGVELK